MNFNTIQYEFNRKRKLHNYNTNQYKCAPLEPFIKLINVNLI